MAKGKGKRRAPFGRMRRKTVETSSIYLPRFGRIEITPVYTARQGLSALSPGPRVSEYQRRAQQRRGKRLVWPPRIY